MVDRFTRIKNKLRKRHQRNKGIKFYGIKSVECNFNPKKRTYNPHFHFIFPSKELAELFMSEWLTMLGEKFASYKGQHKRKVKDTERDMIEIIKYGTKNFTNPEGKERANTNTTHFVYASAMYNIFNALKGHRLFERFGFDLPKQEIEKIEPQQLNEYKEFEFDAEVGNWVDVKTDEEISELAITQKPTFLIETLHE